jgi:hypothetical protein
MGIAVYRRRGGDITATVVDFVLFCFLFLFMFFLLHANGVVVSQLSPAVDIGVTVSSVAATIILASIVLRGETKMASTRKTVVRMNVTPHVAPSTLPSDSCPREAKGEGNKSKDGGCHHRRWW